MQDQDRAYLTKELGKLWRAADELRSKGEPLVSGLLKYIEKTGQQADAFFINTLAILFGEKFVPLAVLQFSEALLARHKPQSILDPNADFGIYLAAAVERTGAQGLGLIKGAQSFETAQLLKRTGPLTWKLGDPLLLLDETHGEFDAVISNLPFGVPRQRIEITMDGVAAEVSDDWGHLILLKSALRLSPMGLGLFVVANSFFFQQNTQSVRHMLGRFGLTLSACLAIPPGSFRPKTSIGANLLVISRGTQAQLFVGELSGEKEHDSLLLNNLLEHKNGADLSLGRLIRPEDFQSYSGLEQQDKITRMAADFGAPQVRLADIAVEMNLAKGESFPERANSIYLPLLGTSMAITDLGQAKLKYHNYIQIVLRESEADARYVAGIFNTPLGMNLRGSYRTGTFIPKISKSSLLEAVFYLPSRDIQLQTVAGASVLGNATTTIRELEQELWQKPKSIARLQLAIKSFDKKETLTQWLDHLPFPLASILWAYHATARDSKAGYEHLLHFFEALAEFMATVLLSAFMSRPGAFEQERSGLMASLAAAKLSLGKGSFGTWKTIVEYLSKQARTWLNGPEDERALCADLFSCSNNDVLEMLSSKSIVSLLQEVNSRRNQWTGHGGIVGEREAKERHALLQSSLSDLRDVFSNKWDLYELVQPRVCRVKSGIFDNEAFHLMGSRTPFQVIERKTTIPLETGSLYLLSAFESRALRLLPLVKVMPAPETEQNACYFYNRQNGEKIRFVSYHFEREAELIDQFADTLDAIKAISG